MPPVSTLTNQQLCAAIATLRVVEYHTGTLSRESAARLAKLLRESARRRAAMRRRQTQQERYARRLMLRADRKG